jgi:ABC-type transporter Mla MlaB component
VWSTRDQSLVVLRLPALVTREYLIALVESILAEPACTTLRLLDFSVVKKVEMAGHQALLSLAELQQRDNSNLQLLGITERLRRDLATTRVLDVLHTGEGDALDTLGRASLGNTGSFSCRSYVLEDASLICLGGKVSGRDLADLGFIECLEHSARDRDCIIDLRNVSLLESSAIIALGPFLPWRAGTSARVLFSGASANVLQMFRMVGLGEPEHFIGDSDLLAMICDGSLAN